MRQERGQQQDAADQEQQVAVAVEVPGPAHDQQGEDVEGMPSAAQAACCLAVGGFQRTITT